MGLYNNKGEDTGKYVKKYLPDGKLNPKWLKIHRGEAMMPLIKKLGSIYDNPNGKTQDDWSRLSKSLEELKKAIIKAFKVEELLDQLTKVIKWLQNLYAKSVNRKGVR
jgi:hypothetical protein